MSTLLSPHITLIGSSFEVRGKLPTLEAKRVSDHLNDTRGMLLLTDAQVVSSSHFGEIHGEIAVNRNDILFAVPSDELPPDHLNRSFFYIEKNPHRIQMLVGNWVVDGTMHLLPDASFDNFLGATTTDFLSITNATLRGHEDDRVEPFLLASRSHITLLVSERIPI